MNFYLTSSRLVLFTFLTIDRRISLLSSRFSHIRDSAFITTIIIAGSLSFIGSTSVAGINKCYSFYRDRYLEASAKEQGERFDEMFYLRSSFATTATPYALGHIYSLSNKAEKKRLQFEYVISDHRLQLTITERKFYGNRPISKTKSRILYDRNCENPQVTKEESDPKGEQNSMVEVGFYKSPFKDKGIQPMTIDGRSSFFEITSMTPIQIINPLTQVMETVNRVKFSMKENPRSTEEITDSQGRLLYVASILGGDLNQRTDFYTKAAWVHLTLEDPPVVIGAEGPTLIASSATAKISGMLEKLSPEKYKNYFKIINQQLTGDRWTAIINFNQFKPPPSLPWNSPVNLEDKSELLFDQQVQREPVEQIANEIRKNLSRPSRFQLARTIGQELQKYIRYEERPGLGLNTAEILAAGVGICHHYSILFTAIARTLGLPTRIRSGYLARQGSLASHAWVEIKINETEWWPFEPQRADGRFFQLGYLPLGFMKTGGTIDLQMLLQPAKRTELGAINYFEFLR